MPEKLIPFRYLPLGLLEVFASLGIEAQAVLSKTGLKPWNSAVDDLRINEKQWQKLLHNAIFLYPKSHLGFTCGQHLHQSYLGPFAAVLACGGSLLNTYHLYYYFRSILQPGHFLQSYESSFYFDMEERLVVIIDNFIGKQDSPHLKVFEIEYQLAFLLRLCEAYCALEDDIFDIKISLGSALQQGVAAHIAKFPKVNIIDGAQTSISIKTRHIRQVFYSLRQPAFRQARRDCLQLIHQYHIPSTVIQVKQHIREVFFISNPSLEKIAFRMATTPRALSRKLAQEKTNFRSVLHEMKMEMAITHLRYSNLTIDTIAAILKFSSASSLRRAVKNWNQHIFESAESKLMGHSL